MALNHKLGSTAFQEMALQLASPNASETWMRLENLIRSGDSSTELGKQAEADSPPQAKKHNPLELASQGAEDQVVDMLATLSPLQDSISANE